MKKFISAAALALLSMPALAEDAAPVNSILPRNLSELGTALVDKTTGMVKESVEDLNLGASEAVTEQNSGAASYLADEPAELQKIREILRNLETQRSVMLRIAEIQKQLIGFAGKDANAAMLSRPPFKVCELILEAPYCTTLAASFAPAPEATALQ